MTYKKKLIEVALPLEAINKEAARENYIYKGNPSAIHKWWAQRPLSVCRAVLFASLVDDPSECVAELMKDSTKRKAAEKELKGRKKLWDEQTATLAKALAGGISAPPPGPEPKLADIVAEIERERLFEIIRDLVKWENSNNERVLNTARSEIMRSCNGNPPPVCDPFCGGGSIPLECTTVGTRGTRYAILNPVPVLITKALIEIPPKFAGKPSVNPEAKKNLSASGSWTGVSGLIEDIRFYGKWMHDRSREANRRSLSESESSKRIWRRRSTRHRLAMGAHRGKPQPGSQRRRMCRWCAHSGFLQRQAKKAWVIAEVDHESMSYKLHVRTGNGEAATRNCGSQRSDLPYEADPIL